MLATWLSYDDLERLVVASLTAPVVGHSIVYGMSDNRADWWDNTPARHLGYAPQDSSEPHRASVCARQPTLDMNNRATLYQGGAFVTQGPYRDRGRSSLTGPLPHHPACGSAPGGWSS